MQLGSHIAQQVAQVILETMTDLAVIQRLVNVQGAVVVDT